MEKPKRRLQAGVKPRSANPPPDAVSPGHINRPAVIANRAVKRSGAVNSQGVTQADKQDRVEDIWLR